MLLNLSIGIGLIVGAIGIPLTLLALCVGKASTGSNRYANTANSEKLPRTAGEPPAGSRLERDTNWAPAPRQSGKNEHADITALTKAS